MSLSWRCKSIGKESADVIRRCTIEQSPTYCALRPINCSCTTFVTAVCIFDKTGCFSFVVYLNRTKLDFKPSLC